MKSLFQKIPTDLGSEHYENTPCEVRQETIGRVKIEEVINEEDIFLTMTFPPAFSLVPKEYTECVQLIVQQLKKLLPKEEMAPILVVGLGNPRVTVDAFGAEVVKMITATAHLQKNGICLFAPDVTESSGIPTEKAISALVDRISPRAVIILDALCARSPKRLGNTLQFSNTCISPGSGLRRQKAQLSKDVLGVPVLVIGMPTIVSTASLILDTLSSCSLPRQNGLESVLKENAFFVCPKEIDIAILRAAALLGDAINLL